MAREKDRRLSDLFKRYGVDSIDIDTAEDYAKPLSVFFRARAKRV
jgi:hypothetical protein